MNMFGWVGEEGGGWVVFYVLREGYWPLFLNLYFIKVSGVTIGQEGQFVNLFVLSR